VLLAVIEQSEISMHKVKSKTMQAPASPEKKNFVPPKKCDLPTKAEDIILVTPGILRKIIAETE